MKTKYYYERSKILEEDVDTIYQSGMSITVNEEQYTIDGVYIDYVADYRQLELIK